MAAEPPLAGSRRAPSRVGAEDRQGHHPDRRGRDRARDTRMIDKESLALLSRSEAGERAATCSSWRRARRPAWAGSTGRGWNIARSSVKGATPISRRAPRSEYRLALQLSAQVARVTGGAPALRSEGLALIYLVLFVEPSHDGRPALAEALAREDPAAEHHSRGHWRARMQGVGVRSTCSSASTGRSPATWRSPFERPAGCTSRGPSSMSSKGLCEKGRSVRPSAARLRCMKRSIGSRSTRSSTSASLCSGRPPSPHAIFGPSAVAAGLLRSRLRDYELIAIEASRTALTTAVWTLASIRSALQEM